VKFELVIFDLDGTLIDSQLDVGHALNRVLADYDVPPIAAEVIRTHVGYGIQPLIVEKLRERDILDVAPAFQSFTRYYFERCAEQTTLYPGVADGLDRLSAHRKVILTNKSTRFIDPILKGLKIDHHFLGQYGRESFAKTKPDPLPIQSILREYGVAPARAVMIGDTETDINAGINAGVPTCLVTYGYGKPEVLKTLRPNFTVERFADLEAHLAD
jgi:phosphoglycolate phosphatase